MVPTGIEGLDNPYERVASGSGAPSRGRRGRAWQVMAVGAVTAGLGIGAASAASAATIEDGGAAGAVVSVHGSDAAVTVADSADVSPALGSTLVAGRPSPPRSAPCRPVGGKLGNPTVVRSLKPEFTRRVDDTASKTGVAYGAAVGVPSLLNDNSPSRVFGTVATGVATTAGTVVGALVEGGPDLLDGSAWEYKVQYTPPPCR